MTNKSGPTWKRKGYANPEEYTAKNSARAKTRNAAITATKVKGKHREILRVMWDHGDFDSTFVKITQQQIMAKADCSRGTAMKARKELIAEGSIVPVKDWQGGRGIVTTWQLKVAGKGETPLARYTHELEREKARQTRFRFLSQKYGGTKAIQMLQDEGFYDDPDDPHDP